MKRIICLVLIVALLVFSMTSCSNAITNAVASAVASSVKSDAAKQSGENASPSQAEKTAAAANNAASGNSPFSQSYQNYYQAKDALATNISNVISADENASMIQLASAMEVASVSISDLSLIPLTVIGMGDDKTTAAALAMLGLNGIKVSGSGNEYKIDYSDGSNDTESIDSKYDPGSDSMTSTMTQNGQFYLLSEYTKTSSGYAGQIYMKNDDGTFYTVKIVTNPDGSSGTIGFSDKQTSQPASIFQKGDGVGADFGKDSKDWYVLAGGKLTASIGGQPYSN